MLGAHVAATSQHLAKLRAAGLVTSRREGTRIYYRAGGAQVRGLLEVAVLAAREAAADAGPEVGAEEAPAVAQERPAPVGGARRAHRPVTER
ncbi:hypothetical protein ACIRNI_29235 [Streptomyces sp. NPDC093546]|uniref:hypothetical protein n=1 Tax=Streptomyces sp. NPDC093546 TaxID=3366040 RepID=UPI00380C1B97